MLDQNVEVKAGATLEENLIASCYAISTDSRGYASFQEVEKPNVKYFDKGVQCYLPLSMELKKYQFMGQQPPNLEEQDESDMEESEDEQIHNEVMSNSKFMEQVQE